MFLLALTLFSIIPPRLLLLLCGIAAVAVLIEILPKSLSAKIVATLKSIGVVLFYLLGGLFVLWLGFIFIRNLLPFFLFWLPLVGLAIAISYLYGNLKTIGRVASTIGLSILALAIPILWGLSTSSSSSPTETTYNPVPNRATNSPVVTPIEVVKPQVPSDTSAITQTLAWDDFSGKRYQITFNLKRSDIRASKDKREQLQVPINANRDFGMLFNKILHRENDQLSSFINQLDSIRTANELMPVAFAETVVSLVQQLEYSLLFEQSCPTTTRLPCKQGVKYGVYTPTEFLYFLRGDCDTKALLLYLIFKEFNYDVAIMGSIFYQHAMLALDLPSERGAALLYENDAFYVWEVTAPGWRLGELPPQSDQLQFWDIILAHNKD